MTDKIPQWRLWALLAVLFVAGAAINSFQKPDAPMPGAAAPPPPDPPDPKYGPRPEFTAKSYARDYLHATLKDPDSTKDFEAYGPTRYSIGEGKKELSGWMIMFQVNAKNSFGAYTGTKRGMLLIKDERVIWVQPPE